MTILDGVSLKSKLKNKIIFMNNFFFYLIIFNFRIFEDGGLGFLIMADKESNFLVQNNFLSRNYGVLGGSFFYEISQGTIMHDSNIFVENHAISIAGIGGCFSFIASSFSFVYGVNNKIMFHTSEYVGTIGCTGGKLLLFDNFFYGKDFN